MAIEPAEPRDDYRLPTCSRPRHQPLSLQDASQSFIAVTPRVATIQSDTAPNNPSFTNLMCLRSTKPIDAKHHLQSASHGQVRHA